MRTLASSAWQGKRRSQMRERSWTWPWARSWSRSGAAAAPWPARSSHSSPGWPPAGCDRCSPAAALLVNSCCQAATWRSVKCTAAWHIAMYRNGMQDGRTSMKPFSYTHTRGENWSLEEECGHITHLGLSSTRAGTPHEKALRAAHFLKHASLQL